MFLPMVPLVPLALPVVPVAADILFRVLWSPMVPQPHSCHSYTYGNFSSSQPWYLLPTGAFTQRASDDVAMHVAMHAFVDAMKRCDWVFTLHAIKPLFPHCQIYICVVKLETCPMRAINVAMDLARVVTRQCEYIIKIYSVLIFPLVALLHRSLARSLCERTLRMFAGYNFDFSTSGFYLVE